MHIELGQLQFWQILVLTILVLGVFSFFVAKGKLTIKGRYRPTFYNSDKTKKPPHKDCPYIRDIFLVMDKVAEISMKKYMIMFKETLHEQMEYTDERSEEVKRLYQNMFLTKLKTLNGVDTNRLARHRDYQFFGLLLKTLIKDGSDFVRMSFIQDREYFATSNDTDFRTYIQEKIETLSAKIVEFFELMYTSSNLISLKDLLSTMREKRQDAEQIFYSIMFTSREIVKAKIIKVAELDKELEVFIVKYIGRI